MLLNHNTGARLGRGFDVCDAHQLLDEDLSVSPAYDELTLYTPRPHRLLRMLLPDPDHVRHGILGLRCLDSDPDGTWYRLLHLPIGGHLRLHYPVDRPRHHESENTPPPQWNPDPARHRLTRHEELAFGYLPAMTGEEESLLAALLARLSTHDPDRGWALGAFSSDPLDRSLPGALVDRSHLWGDEGSWRLYYNRFTPPHDVAAALTDPNIGLRGAEAEMSSDTEARLRYGDTTLTVTRYGAPYDLIRGRPSPSGR
ncbi:MULTISPECIES: hypothetical protein [unclassified Crossiella]|uniref:hypothetical protein n=1 Tax=unclassified Crossiella TaxID=2620835 RepID=UPI001FFF728D|nr:MULTISPECIES: hypothetical protein [unclassified Crossiella]MCK2245455.1 hypothetical protein [Crossiella sp. S99.2]MCK2259107.1 hypothetical protein [Crossiella sp. S99.1]